MIGRFTAFVPSSITSRTRAARAYASSSPTSPRLAQGKRPWGSGPSRLLDVQRLQVSEESRIAPASSSRTIQTKHPFNIDIIPVSYTHLRAHETVLDLVCRLLLEK